jgi:hypothetical protein
MPRPPGAYVVDLPASRLSGSRIVIPVDWHVAGLASELTGSVQQDAKIDATWKGTVTLAR